MSMRPSSPQHGSPEVHPVRTLVVGVGWAGRRQLEAAGEIPGLIEFVGIAEPDALQRSATASEFSIEATFDTLKDALTAADVEAVSICAPHHLHRPMVLAAIAAGKDVLCEKPLAMTLEDATEMVDAAERAGVVLTVNEQDAFEPIVDQLVDLLASGKIGEFVSASLVWGFASRDFSYPGRRAWLTVPSAGGTGTWMLHGVHKVAQLRAVLGEVTSVAAIAHRTGQFERRDIEGSMRALLELERGGSADLLVSSESPVPEGWRWTLFGTDAVVTATPTSLSVAAADGTTTTLAPETGTMSSYARTLADFAASVRTRRPGRTSGRSERRTLAVVVAGDESARTGDRVVLDRNAGWASVD